MDIKEISIEDRTEAIIAEQLGCNINDIRPESKLADELGADSLDVVELVMCIEDEFDIDIPDEAWAGFKTVQDVTDYIAERAA